LTNAYKSSIIISSYVTEDELWVES